MGRNDAIDLFEVKREKSGGHTITSVRIAKIGGKKVKAKPIIIEEDYVNFFDSEDDVDDDNIPF